MPTVLPTTAVKPSQAEAGTSGRVCPVSGVRPYRQIIPLPSSRACGRYRRRICDLIPSAATRISARADRPSLKQAVTPQESCSKPVQVRPNSMTPSSRAARISRKVWRFTEVDKVAGSSGSAGGLISVRRSDNRPGR